MKRKLLFSAATATASAVVTAALLTVPTPASAAYVQITPPASNVTASTNDGNLPGNVVDDNYTSRWSGFGDGAWLQLDLGSSKLVSHIKVAVHYGTSRKNDFELQVFNGSSWVTVFDGRSSGTTTGLEVYDFTDLQGSRVRYVGHGYYNLDGSFGKFWNSVTEVEIWGEGTPPTSSPTPTSTGGTCTYPADVLNLNNWKVTLPIDDPNQSGTQPLEIKQPALDSYRIDPWFKTTSDCRGVQFRNAVNGAHTPNSSYARSELREMTNNGSSNASWSSTSGTHTMVISQAITNLPNDKPHVVAGQIHDSEDDVTVFRLEGSSLYITNGDTTHHKLITSNYVLGTRFEAKFVVSGGQIRAYYNGTLVTTLSKSFSGGYFKAGAYTQANCENSDPCSTSNYGQVIVYSVSVTHA